MMNRLLVWQVGRWHKGFSIVMLSYALLSGCAAQKHSKEVPKTKTEPKYTILQEKLDSHLSDMLVASKQRTTVDSMAAPASKTGNSLGNIAVDIRATVTDSLLENIKGLGGTIIYPSQQYQTIRATIPVLQLEILARYKAVIFIATAAKATTNH